MMRNSIPLGVLFLTSQKGSMRVSKEISVLPNLPDNYPPAKGQLCSPRILRENP